MTECRNHPNDSTECTGSGNSMSAAEFRDLIHGWSNTYLALYLGVDPSTFRRWKTGKGRIPIAVERLLKIRICGLDALGGAEWRGFRFGEDNLFYHPSWRKGFDPREIRAMFYKVQISWHHERTITALEKRIEELEREVLEANANAAKYRRIILSEARFGLMFERIPYRISLDGDGHHEALS